MQFEDVPPGTGDAAALTLRGADHVVEVTNAHSLMTSMGNALQAGAR